MIAGTPLSIVGLAAISISNGIVSELGIRLNALSKRAGKSIDSPIPQKQNIDLQGFLQKQA